METIDLNEIDKTYFKCYRFEDNSIYFGEIAYIDGVSSMALTEKDLDSYSEEKIRSMKRVRHGNGVQLFGVEENDCLCRYEGEWLKDKKNGKGICYYPDGSVYEGNFSNDLFDGFGKFSWPNNDTYIGQWKTGLMEGEGEFKHHDGHILKGLFKNNYYFDKERFTNPFLSSEELERFKLKNKEYTEKLKKQNEKFSRNSIHKISNHEEFVLYLEETIKQNKTPLIIRSIQDITMKKSEVLNLLGDQKEFDLRQYYLKLRNSHSGNKEVFSEIRSLVTDSLIKGLTLLLNFDDCSVKYEELFDPDMKEFYGTMMLSPFMWRPEVFSRSYWQSHLNTKVTNFKLDKNFKFVVYSKFTIDLSLADHEVVNLIEKRFEKNFSLLNVNVLVLSNFKN